MYIYIYIQLAKHHSSRSSVENCEIFLKTSSIQVCSGIGKPASSSAYIYIYIYIYMHTYIYIYIYIYHNNNNNNNNNNNDNNNNVDSSNNNNNNNLRDHLLVQLALLLELLEGLCTSYDIM